jgi:hypothetical protein
MVFDRTTDRMREFVKARMPSEVKFVEMYFESGCTFVGMKKAVSDGKGGCIVQDADPMRIVYNPVLDIRSNFAESDVGAVQNKLMNLNPGLKPTCKSCIRAANADPVAGNEYAWHTGNGYARSVVLKFPHFSTYCETGVSPLKAPTKKRNEEKGSFEATKKQAVSSADTKLSRYFQTAPVPTRLSKEQTTEQTREAEGVATRPSTPSLLYSVPQELSVLPVKKDEAAGRRNPPNACVQMLRTAALCAPLISYLKARNKFTTMGKAHWKAIGDWTKTEEGMAWLRAAEIDPLGVQLDHIVSQNGMGAGYDSIFNCYFMPPAPNQWFDSFDNREKRAYIGKQAFEIARRFSKWIKHKVERLAKQNPELFDQNKFNPIVL